MLRQLGARRNDMRSYLASNERRLGHIVRNRGVGRLNNSGIGGRGASHASAFGMYVASGPPDLVPTPILGALVA